MPASTSPANEAVDYRFFVCDLMTNELLAEMPFRNVSFSRSLTEAGTFNGDIAVTPDTYNLSVYENTLPARTALYVVRNNVCVWGGIIWGRTYSLIDKVLSITAAEFTSYLNHRVVWKTWSSSYAATAEVANGTLTATLIGGQYNFTEGEPVYIYWPTDYNKYNGYFEVLTISSTSDDRSIITAPATFTDALGVERDIPNLSMGEDNAITIETRQDTYQYAQDLLRELNTDLFDFDFANDLIRPGIDLFNEIASVSRSGNVATVVTTKKHELTPGQKIKISDVSVGTGFDNPEAIVKDIISDYSISYVNTGNNVSSTNETDHVKIISSFKRSANIATFETTSAHGLSEGQIILIENVSETFDGYFTVYGTPASTTAFQVVMYGANIAKSYTDTVASIKPTLTRRAAMTYSTFGEHSKLGDIGFDLSENDEFSSFKESNPIIRGFELKTVASIFEEYSTKPHGFEYRVDCEYDATTNSFKKHFRFLSILPKSLTDWLADQPNGTSDSVPASAYGADQFIFEYPGNILEAEFEENADEAATRFFVQGKDSELSEGASQPYSAASNHKLLRQGWPILDAVETLDSLDEIVLWKQASRLLSESIPPISTFTISTNGSAYPVVGSYKPGDWCSVKLNDTFVSLRADSYLEQDYGADNGVLVRKIISYSVEVPDTPSYPEKVSLELVTEPSVPISGVLVIDGKVFNGN
jgi:hypothetical protein